MTTYTYGMKNRGFSFGCQPMNGLVERIDDDYSKYYDLLVYDRKLTQEEVDSYELDFIGNPEDLEVLEFGKKEFESIKAVAEKLSRKTLKDDDGFLYMKYMPERKEVYLEYNTSEYSGSLEFLVNPVTGKYSVFDNETYVDFNVLVKRKLEYLVKKYIESDWELGKETKQENKATITPMIKELEKLFVKLNDKYFDGELETPVITIAPDTCRAYGWFTTYRAWQETDNKDGEGYYEITITSDYLNMEPEEIAGTLLHEMVHLYCKMNNIRDCSNNGHYHNKRFKEAAESHGLIANKVSGGGGFTDTKPTPETSAYLKTLNLEFPLYRKSPVKGRKTKKSNSRKYVCPICGAIIRATKQVNVICGDCEVPFIEVEE